MQSDFVNRANTEYIDQLYQRYQTDPRSIDPQWQEFFSRMDWEMPRPGGNGEESGKSARQSESVRAGKSTPGMESARPAEESSSRVNGMAERARRPSAQRGRLSQMSR